MSEFTSRNNEKCETILNEWWCVSLHHIAMRSERLYSMQGRDAAKRIVAL